MDILQESHEATDMIAEQIARAVVSGIAVVVYHVGYLVGEVFRWLGG
jgi:trehalose utilization protein